MMTVPKLFDGVELRVDLPDRDLAAGARGIVVDVYSDEVEVEFADSEGETLTLTALPTSHVNVVWRSPETANPRPTPRAEQSPGDRR